MMVVPSVWCLASLEVPKRRVLALAGPRLMLMCMLLGSSILSVSHQRYPCFQVNTILSDYSGATSSCQGIPVTVVPDLSSVV